MSAGARGLQPSRMVGDLLADIIAVTPGVEVSAFDVFNKPSANIGFEDVEDIVAILAREADAGCDGLVLVQGTDTIEETAFAIELLNRVRIPVIVTGAMRGASSPGADGPANLAGAVIAARDVSTGMGAVVVLNDEAHAARWVRKAHTSATGAFTSGEQGLLGRIHEGSFVITHRQLPYLALPSVTHKTEWPRIALLRVAMADKGEILAALPDMGFSGCVIEAMGAGHVPADIMPVIDKLAAHMPVVMSSRTGDGLVCTHTYAYAGSETDLLARGVVPAGRLSGLKARVLLAACIRYSGKAAALTFREIASKV